MLLWQLGPRCTEAKTGCGRVWGFHRGRRGRFGKKTADDLVGAPQYAGYATTAYSPKPVRFFRRIKQFAYEMMGIVSPPDAPKNMLIDLGIIEEA